MADSPKTVSEALQLSMVSAIGGAFKKKDPEFKAQMRMLDVLCKGKESKLHDKKVKRLHGWVKLYKSELKLGKKADQFLLRKYQKEIKKI